MLSFTCFLGFLSTGCIYVSTVLTVCMYIHMYHIRFPGPWGFWVTVTVMCCTYTYVPDMCTAQQSQVCRVWLDVLRIRRGEKRKVQNKMQKCLTSRFVLFYDGRSVRLWRCGTGGVVAGWAELYVCMYESMLCVEVRVHIGVGITGRGWSGDTSSTW